MALTNVHPFRHIKMHCLAICGRWQREANRHVMATALWFLIHWEKSLCALSVETHKCQWWLCRGLESITWYIEGCWKVLSPSQL